MFFFDLHTPEASAIYLFWPFSFYFSLSLFLSLTQSINSHTRRPSNIHSYFYHISVHTLISLSLFFSPSTSSSYRPTLCSISIRLHALFDLDSSPRFVRSRFVSTLCSISIRLHALFDLDSSPRFSPSLCLLCHRNELPPAPQRNQLNVESVLVSTISRSTKTTTMLIRSTNPSKLDDLQNEAMVRCRWLSFTWTITNRWTATVSVSLSYWMSIWPVNRFLCLDEEQIDIDSSNSSASDIVNDKNEHSIESSAMDTLPTGESQSSIRITSFDDDDNDDEFRRTFMNVVPSFRPANDRISTPFSQRDQRLHRSNLNNDSSHR